MEEEELDAKHYIQSNVEKMSRSYTEPYTVADRKPQEALEEFYAATCSDPHLKLEIGEDSISYLKRRLPDWLEQEKAYKSSVEDNVTSSSVDVEKEVIDVSNTPSLKQTALTALEYSTGIFHKVVDNLSRSSFLNANKPSQSLYAIMHAEVMREKIYHS